MKRASPVELLIAVSPIIWGLAFIGAVKLGQAMFLGGVSDPIISAMMEIFTMFIGLLLSIGQFGMLIRYILKRRWVMALISVLTPPVWFACVEIGISMGAAIVYAT